MPQILTANRLGDGRVVFRHTDGSWAPHTLGAAVAEGKPDAEVLAAAGKADEALEIVVDTYLVDVDLSGPAPRPTRLREAIRAEGPTVPFGTAAIPGAHIVSGDTR